MTAVLEIQGRGRTAFFRPVSSRALGSPPAGPWGAPGRLQTLADTMSGKTLLWRAADNGYEEVVRELLEQDEVNPNAADQDGQTPLSRAACNGYEGVVRILLERDDVDPVRADENGRTPLS